MAASSYTVAALYKFTKLEDPAALQAPLLALCRRLGLKGTLLLATEGVNGTVAGTATAIETLLTFLRRQPALATLTHKVSYTDKMPFLRMKVKLKREIVTLGQPQAKPMVQTGQYVTSQAWEALLQDPDVHVIDTRNRYEIDVGTFVGADNPQTDNFRDFPDYVEQTLKPKAPQKIAMFCTGGIRCEKASAYLLEQGFTEVYQLKGGILKYLEERPKSTLWQGECFVSDNRVTVDKHLAPGTFAQCFGCRYPVSPAAMAKGPYKAGVYCPRCYTKASPQNRARAQERQKQMSLAATRGETHLGEA